MKKILLSMAVLVMVITSCTFTTKGSVLNTFPLEETNNVNELVWVGYGTPYLYNDGTWVAAPTENYSFMVYQKRFNDAWKSHKIMNRINAAYSGKAGNADQQHLFIVDYTPSVNGMKPFEIHSTMGNGNGTIDEQFNNATMLIKADVSSFAPYSHIRLTQTYNYKKGELNEVIELIKISDDDSEIPFMKINETANLFKR